MSAYICTDVCLCVCKYTLAAAPSISMLALNCLCASLSPLGLKHFSAESTRAFQLDKGIAI